MEEKSKTEFPFEVEEVDRVKYKDLYDYLEGFNFDLMKIGPKKYVVTRPYMSEAANIYNFPLRSDDIFLVTFPKSGTTMTQDLMWLLENNLDYEKAKSININARFPFLEIAALIPTDIPAITPEDKMLSPPSLEETKKLPSPRLIKTHMSFSLLPSSLLDTTKVVYVARNPKDVAVSYYHHHKLTRMMPSDRDFKTFWKYFMTDNVIWSPYFEHLFEAWERRNHPNMLFLFYEDYLKDLPGTIRRIAKFLNKTLTDDQVQVLCRHLHFDNFKNNTSVNMTDYQKHGVFINSEFFMRNGKVGGWRKYFDDEMMEEANEWISKHLSNIDLSFPQI